MNKEEIKQERLSKAKALVDKWQEKAGETATAARAKWTQANQLREQAAALEAEARGVMSGFSNAVDKVASATRFRLQDERAVLEVVPWLRTVTADQIILGIGDDEYVVANAPDYTMHVYGAPSESGHRFCLFPDHKHEGGVVLPSYTLGIFGELPKPTVSSEVEVSGE